MKIDIFKTEKERKSFIKENLDSSLIDHETLSLNDVSSGYIVIYEPYLELYSVDWVLRYMEAFEPTHFRNEINAYVYEGGSKDILKKLPDEFQKFIKSGNMFTRRYLNHMIGMKGFWFSKDKDFPITRPFLPTGHHYIWVKTHKQGTKKRKRVTTN